MSGRHFLQIPGPTNVPDRVLRALAQPTIDHRGAAFARLAKDVLASLQRVFQTEHAVVVFPSSGTGAWEAALVNTLSPGDRILMFETGHFAALWKQMAERLGLKPESLSRAFAKLRTVGVEVRASHVAIRDVARLRQLAADDRGAMRGALRDA